MFGIFMESLVILKLYTGLRLLLLLTVVALIWLLIKEKDSRIRILFIYAPIIILLIFLFPVTRKVFVAAGLDGETYYRVLWTVPMGMITIYAACRFFEKYRKIGLCVMAGMIVLCGKYVYSSGYITHAENMYHIPNRVVDVCDFVKIRNGEIPVKMLVPDDMIHFIRQYDATISMPYGREMLVDRWGYYHAVYEEMEKPEVITMAKLIKATREEHCQYIVLKRERETDVDPEKAGLQLVTLLDGYRIYEDPVIAKEVAEWMKYYDV